MKKGEEQRDSFSGKLGFILTCIGFAVGIGNLVISSGIFICRILIFSKCLF